MNTEGPSVSAIEAAILKYVEAYATLESLQRNSYLLPGGDQKTGVVGEYYATLFALGSFPTACIELAFNSQKAWDIRVDDKFEIKIQVKTISEFSKTGKISTIKADGWDILYIIHLDHKFLPNGFWVVTPANISAKGDLKEIYGPRPNIPKNSKKIDFGVQMLDEFLDGVARGKARLIESKQPCIQKLIEKKLPSTEDSAKSRRTKKLLATKTS